MKICLQKKHAVDWKLKFMWISTWAFFKDYKSHFSQRKLKKPLTDLRETRPSKPTKVKFWNIKYEKAFEYKNIKYEIELKYNIYNIRSWQTDAVLKRKRNSLVPRNLFIDISIFRSHMWEQVQAAFSQKLWP